MAITIKDIAKDVGVSRSLVSLYLTTPETTRVAEATKRHIDESVQRLGYLRNEAAAQIRTGKNRTIAFLIDFASQSGVSSSALMIIMGGLQATAKNGSSVKIYQASNSDDFLHIHDELLRYDIRYVVCFSFDKSIQVEIGDFCQKHKISLCYIQESARGEFPRIYTDDRAAVREAIHWFLMRGHCRIAFLGPAVGVTYGDERFAGFVQGLEENGHFPDPSMISRKQEIPSHYADLRRMLCMSEKKRPTAFFCCDDSRAQKLLIALLASGKRMPEDCEIMGFGDTLASNLCVPMSSIRQPFQAMGEAAVERVISKKLAKGNASDLFPCQLIHHQGVDLQTCKTKG